MSLILQWRSFYNLGDISRILILVVKTAPIISTEIFRMAIGLLETFFHTQSFFIVSNQIQTIFVSRGTGSKERKLLNSKMSSETFTQDTKAISNYLYLLQPSVICFYSTLWYQPIGTKRNPGVAVYLQSPINYSNNTSTLPLTLQLRYKLFGILQRVIKNK